MNNPDSTAIYLFHSIVCKKVMVPFHYQYSACLSFAVVLLILLLMGTWMNILYTFSIHSAYEIISLSVKSSTCFVFLFFVKTYCVLIGLSRYPLLNNDMMGKRKTLWLILTIDLIFSVKIILKCMQNCPVSNEKSISDN